MMQNKLMKWKKETAVQASAVKTYMRNGWVPIEQLPQQQQNNTQQGDRPLKASISPAQQNRQKSWVPWPKF
ncbi:hypothetical protein [Pontibacter rugosus]|uniref:Uncharacterized protein n=1 Tax=Pontibacter rugosus TaxID=1745966 RepID=A0ABW3SU48_9BACT